MSLKDEKSLKGRSLWVSAGGQMEFYPYNHAVDYAHPAGTLLGTEKIAVTDAVEQAVPKSAGKAATFRIPAGDKQVLLVFTKLFSFWGPDIWKAIDEHRAILGMNERQVQTALGQISDPHGDTIGERTVIYDDGGKPKRITFSGGKATKIETVPE